MAISSYIKTVWKNLSAPAINDTNLNKIEQGIFDATEALIPLTGDVSSNTQDILKLKDNGFYEYIKFEGGTAAPKDISGTTWINVLDKDLGHLSEGVYEYKHSITYQMDTVQKSAHFRFSLDGGTTWEERTTEVKDKTNIEDKDTLFPLLAPSGGIDVHFMFEAKTETTSGEKLSIYYASQMLDKKK